VPRRLRGDRGAGAGGADPAAAATPLGPDQAAERLGVRRVEPSTFLQTTFYWENLLGPIAPRRGDDGRLVLAMPMADSPLAGIAAEDIGKTAYGIFRRGGDLVGRTVSIAGEHLTGKQMAEQLSAALGEEVAYMPVPFDAMRAQPFPAAAEMGNMFQFYAEVPQFNAVRDLDVVRDLNPQLQTFQQWLNAHKHAFAGA
jgi:uncharacterized protein YbjT (DUF2867 family)